MHLLCRPARRILPDRTSQIVQRLAHRRSRFGPEASILIGLGAKLLDFLPELIAFGLEIGKTGAGRYRALVNGGFQPCQRRAESLHRFIELAHPSPHPQARTPSCLSALTGERWLLGLRISCEPPRNQSAARARDPAQKSPT